MLSKCRQPISGGKGNRGMFIERNPNLVAAGLPTAQQDDKVVDVLQHYLLKDEVDALINDAITPPPKKQPLPTLRNPIPLDTRHAALNGGLSDLLSPPNKTKFENLVTEFKETSYSSYWKKALGDVKDSVPMLPEGFDTFGTTFGKATPFCGRLYDIVMPKQPYPDNTPPSKEPSAQIDRNYCTPAYNPDLTYGHRTFVKKGGSYARCCLNDDRISVGTGSKAVVNSIQSNFQDATQSRVGSPLAPNNNIGQVPTGYTFGILKPPDNLPECLTFCERNKEVDFIRKCLKHLNTVRRGLSKTKLPTFFYKFYLTLKYYDAEQTGWLLKDFVYKNCGIQLIRFDPNFMEPLLSIWQAFDGSRIEYKIFVRVIDYRIPSPEIPKIPDLEPNCLKFRTTYTEMVEPGQVTNNQRRAGLPSGRYLDLNYPTIPDNCCAADIICLPQEKDIKCCISPSILTQVFVDHRDMYRKQGPENVRRVFEAAEEKFTDERFSNIWEEAKNLHSQGWVCYETFRRALEKYPAKELTEAIKNTK